MIIPNGKKRDMVSQGGFKHESIWNNLLKDTNSDVLEKIALVTPEKADTGKVPGELQKAVSDSNSSQLNPSKIPQAGEMKGQGAGNDFMPGQPDANSTPSAMEPAQQGGQGKPKFDQFTGEPLSGVDGMGLGQMLKQWLGSNEKTSDLEITGWNQKGLTYNITIAPKGKMVTKGNM